LLTSWHNMLNFYSLYVNYDAVMDINDIDTINIYVLEQIESKE